MLYYQKTASTLNDAIIILVIGLLCMLNVKTFAQQKNPGSSKINGFRASVVKVNISPDTPKQLLGYGARLSTGIHDSIYHRIIALDDGITQFFLVSTDICLVSPSEYDHVAVWCKRNWASTR